MSLKGTLCGLALSRVLPLKHWSLCGQLLRKPLSHTLPHWPWKAFSGLLGCLSLGSYLLPLGTCRGGLHT